MLCSPLSLPRFPLLFFSSGLFSALSLTVEAVAKNCCCCVVAGSDVSSAITAVDDASFASLVGRALFTFLSALSLSFSQSLSLTRIRVAFLRLCCVCVLLSILLLFPLLVRIRSIWLKCCLCLRCCYCCCGCGAFFSGCFTVYSYFSIFCFVLKFFLRTKSQSANKRKQILFCFCLFLLVADWQRLPTLAT